MGSVDRFCSIRPVFNTKQRETPSLHHNICGPPPGDFHNCTHVDWIAAADQIMLSAIELIRLIIDCMAERGFGRIINITSSTVRASNRRNFCDQSVPFGYAKIRAETSCLHSSVLKGFKELHSKGSTTLLCNKAVLRCKSMQKKIIFSGRKLQPVAGAMV